MLIECPECNHTVSDKAKTCPNCGIDIQECLEKRIFVEICPKCGSTTWHSDGKCEVCDTDIINTEFYFFTTNLDKAPDADKKAFDKYCANNPDFSKELNEKFKSLYRRARTFDYTEEDDKLWQEFKRETSKKYNHQKLKPEPRPTPEKITIKCPNCGSTNTKRVTATSRMAGVLTLGLASSSIGKQYMCKRCKYKW